MKEFYVFTNGWTMQREEPWPHYWLLCDSTGKIIDRDRYRHDLIPRHMLTVEQHVDWWPA